MSILESVWRQTYRYQQRSRLIDRLRAWRFGKHSIKRRRVFDRAELKLCELEARQYWHKLPEDALEHAERRLWGRIRRAETYGDGEVAILPIVPTMYVFGFLGESGYQFPDWINNLPGVLPLLVLILLAFSGSLLLILGVPIARHLRLQACAEYEALKKHYPDYAWRHEVPFP